MPEWTREAEEYLDGYLRQVAALVRHQGDESDEIVSELRQHVYREVESAAGSLVTLDQLRKTLAAVGTPEQVAAADTPLTVSDGASAGSAPRPEVAPPAPVSSPPSTPPPQRIIVERKRSRLATGCIISLVALALAVVVIPIAGIVAAIALPAFSRSRQAARRATCANNLKQLGLVFKEYSNESPGGYYPPVRSNAGAHMPPVDSLYRRYLRDASMFVCPSDPVDLEVTSDNTDLIDDQSYFYLGHILTSQEDVEAYAAAYREAAGDGMGFDRDFVLPGGRVIRRTASGAVTDLNAKARSEIPILVDRSDNHHPRGGNVLFMDGHVEYLLMDERFPMTEAFFNVMKSIDDDTSNP